MKNRLWTYARVWAVVFLCVATQVGTAVAAPYAAMVIDARSGEVLHARNADSKLHPASLTKMMTLYIVFEAVTQGEISMDTTVTISRNAAAEPPSKLGLRAGQRIKMRYLVRAAAVKSANDAATALGEAISGSEEAFARRMTQTAKALGMTRTTFRNAHGLTQSGHLSTARDMTALGRHLFYDYPQYYNIFSRRSTDAGMKMVNNTNRRLLGAYRGADGIKTGYTNAAGFNLVASADRGGERIIATVFGGRSTATRNARVAELLDMGFSRAPSRVAIRRPARPIYDGSTVSSGIGLVSSLRPRLRPLAEPVSVASAVEEAASVPLDVTSAVDEAVTLAAIAPPPLRPIARPALATAAATATVTDIVAVATSDDVALEPAAQEVVTRFSTSGGRHWGINLGQYGSRHQAERVLLKTALVEIGTLDDALRKVVPGNRGFEANFVGMTQDSAALACRRLTARDLECSTLGPSG